MFNWKEIYERVCWNVNFIYTKIERLALKITSMTKVNLLQTLIPFESKLSIYLMEQEHIKAYFLVKDCYCCVKVFRIDKKGESSTFLGIAILKRRYKLWWFALTWMWWFQKMSCRCTLGNPQCFLDQGEWIKRGKLPCLLLEDSENRLNWMIQLRF